jgi:nucleotide-binding universal stress UspA family protein
MDLHPSVLCPIDFSASSRGALRYAAAIAAHFGSSLTLLAVIDPLLEEADELAGSAHLAEETRSELRRFFTATFAERAATVPETRFDIARGKPAPAILKFADEQRSGIIVMSSHGATGIRKLFFGSTTERVLRETSIPVLVTPGNDPGPESREEVPRLVRRVLAPVDLTAASSHQSRVARTLAEAAGVPLLLLHVVEPVRAFPGAQLRSSKVDAERRYRAERALEKELASRPGGPKTEVLVAFGEPAEEIAKVATDRQAGVIVMGLHSSPVLGPRMGSVTYRVLCLAHCLVLAIPPLKADQAPLATSTSANRLES